MVFDSLRTLNCDGCRVKTWFKDNKFRWSVHLQTIPSGVFTFVDPKDLHLGLFPQEHAP